MPAVKPRHAWALGLIALAAMLVYSNSLRNGFAWDDRVVVLDNAFVSQPANLRYLLDWRYYAQGHAVLSGTRPVFLASLLVDRFFWGAHPGGYHLTNVLLHALSSGWVYGLALFFFPAGPLPLLAGLAFAVHPALSEAVNAVSFRADLLATFFLLPALWLYLKARRAPPKAALALVGGSAGLYGLGLLSKEMAATLPALALTAEFYFPAACSRRRMAWALAAYAAVALAFAGFWAPRFRYSNLPERSALRSVLDTLAARLPSTTARGTLPLSAPPRSHVFAPSPPPWTSLYEDKGVWLRTTAKTFALYARLLLWPAKLVADRTPALSLRWNDPAAAACAAIVLLWAAAGVWLRRRNPAAGYGLAWCLIALLPVSGILPLQNPVAERYLYLVAPGFAWALAAAFGELGKRPPRRVAAAVLAALMLGGLAARTRWRNRDWSSETALFLEGTAEADLSARARYIRAAILRGQGRLGESTRELEQALILHPGFAEAWMALGFAHAQSGRNERARPCFERAVALSPGNPVLHFGFAQFLGARGDAAGAAAHYQAAVNLEPRYLEAWVNLGALHRDAGRLRLARACYEKALPLAGRDPVPFYSYGLLLEKAGEKGRARELYACALDRAPGYQPAQAGLARLRPAKR